MVLGQLKFWQARNVLYQQGNLCGNVLPFEVPGTAGVVRFGHFPLEGFDCLGIIGIAVQALGQPKINNSPGGKHRIVVFGAEGFSQSTVAFWFSSVQTIDAQIQ